MSYSYSNHSDTAVNCEMYEIQLLLRLCGGFSRSCDKNVFRAGISLKKTFTSLLTVLSAVVKWLSHAGQPFAVS